MNKTTKLVLIGLLSAVAFVFVLFGRIPMVLFLNYDPKDIVIAIGGFILGPLSALFISICVSFLEMISISADGVIGFLMNVIASASFACTASYVYRKNGSRKNAAIGLILGMLLMTAMMIFWNYIVTPVYLKIPRQAVVDLLVPAILPFNLIKGSINALITVFLYKPITLGLRRAGVAK